jgi:hypothetical protein
VHGEYYRLAEVSTVEIVPLDSVMLVDVTSITQAMAEFTVLGRIHADKHRNTLEAVANLLRDGASCREEQELRVAVHRARRMLSAHLVAPDGGA